MLSSKKKKSIIHYFRSRNEIRLGYLFGSQAQNRANPLSDIDLAILLRRRFKTTGRLYPYGYTSHVLTDLMKLLKTNNVDLVILNDASYFLRHQVIAGGKTLFVRNALDRIQFEADIMSRYPDFQENQPNQRLRRRNR